MLCFFKHDNVSKFKVILKSLIKPNCKMELSITEVNFFILSYTISQML